MEVATVAELAGSAQARPHRPVRDVDDPFDDEPAGSSRRPLGERVMSRLRDPSFANGGRARVVQGGRRDSLAYTSHLHATRNRKRPVEGERARRADRPADLQAGDAAGHHRAGNLHAGKGRDRRGAHSPGSSRGASGDRVELSGIRTAHQNIPSPPPSTGFRRSLACCRSAARRTL